MNLNKQHFPSFNEHDYRNLSFLMSMSGDDSWQSWADSVPVDDLKYALELLQRANSELVVRELELADDVTDLTDAERICNIFSRN